MIIPIELSFKADKDTRLAVSTNKTIKSHDINSVEFHIAIEGLELTNNHTARILSIFHSSQSQLNTDCEIVDGKIIYKPDTKLISMHETVTNYVYVYYNDKSVDVCEFNYTVKLSKIDETALEVKTVYDQSYADLLANFEQALSEYKDSLPQADSVRAEIDVILNQFIVDSQAKLSQYDDDAQQVIADNQTAFDLAETGRQDSYVQAESERNQSSEQTIVDWKQGADGLVDSKLSEIQTDASTLINGAIDDFNMRGDAEIAEWRGNADSELEEYLADRVVLENLSTRPLPSSLTSLYLDDFTGNTSDVWYAYIEVRYIQYNSGRTRLTLRNYGSSSNVDIVEFDGRVSENFESYSIQASGKINGTRLMISNAGLIDFEVALRNLIVLNLTETFGAGNEPSKSEMDELIKITGYFNEITLTQKQTLNWQLKLMRQNRNALIALGGTII